MEGSYRCGGNLSQHVSTADAVVWPAGHSPNMVVNLCASTPAVQSRSFNWANYVHTISMATFCHGPSGSSGPGHSAAVLSFDWHKEQARIASRT